MDKNIGNITTIIKTISMIIAGWAIGTAAAHNLDLGIDAATLSQVIAAIIFFILAYFDAKYPNNLKIFKNNTPEDQPSGEVVLNDEYEYDDLEEGDDMDGI